MSKYLDIREGYPRDYGNFKNEANAVVHEYQILKAPSTCENLDEAVKQIDEAKIWDEIRDAMAVLVNAVNRHSPEKVAKAMLIGMINNHRTLQASFFKALFKFFDLYKDASYDLRNHSAVVAAAQVTEFAKEEYIGFPLI